MKCLNIKKIKSVVAKSIIKDDNGYVHIVYFPYQLCLMCGWDKQEYDQYFMKYCANLLIGQEKECFECLYLGIQKVLAIMEALSIQTKNGKPILSPASCKLTTELWNPVSFSNKNNKSTQIDKLKKLKEQQDAPEDTPIKLE